MPKKPLSDLKTMLQAEKLDALAATRASKLSSERVRAADYYVGDMSADMPAQDGRSKAVSTDVSDTIDGLLPSLMEIFCGCDDVVRFDPVGPEDVQAAEQETDYVNHVFMQQNAGFLVLHNFIKDALLSKVGIVKVWWEEREEEERETYYDIPDDSYALLASNPDIEIVEHTKHDASELPAGGVPSAPQGQPLAAAEGNPGAPQLPAAAPPGQAMQPGAPGQLPAEAPPAKLHDVTVVTKKTVGKACVVGVPPEEFGISRFARSIRDTGYCFHEVIKREEDLIADGYDREQIKGIPTYAMLTNPEELARDTVDEHLAASGDEGVNEVNRQIKVTEHYVRMDYEGNNKPALYKVTTGGDQGEILDKDGEPEIVRVDGDPPFAAMTPVIISHRFFGRSIADLVMDIQRIKTAILRGILDNTYLANNPRVVVSETGSTDNTLDDLLVSRPGGIVRAKSTDAVEWQVVPNIAAGAFPVLQYMDQIREWRSGVSHTSQGLDAEALQNQSATAAQQVYNAAQAKMKFIARIFAETGIKDMFSLLHATIRKNGSQAATVRLRNQWVTVDPRDWKKRDDMTINVGLGSGGKMEQMQQLGMIINAQKDAVAAGKSNLVTDKNLYYSAQALTKLAGRKDGEDFFTDPKDQPAPQAPPDPKLMQIQAQAELQQAKQQTDAAHQHLKLQADMAAQNQKFQLNVQEMLVKNHMEMQRHVQEMHQSNQQHVASLTEIAAKIHAANVAAQSKSQATTK